MPDAELLAAAVLRDFPNPVPRVTAVDSAPPPVRVIDCVLSLRRPYLKVVEPRVLAFLRDYPDIVSCEQLHDLMLSEGASLFLERRLRMQFPQRAEILLNVTRRMIEVQAAIPGQTELERLERWARDARPHDSLAFKVKGFGIAGFQYLRLLFGANTTKPDVHIVRYVSRVVGREVTDLEALELLERAAAAAGLPARTVDSVVWQRGVAHA